MDYKKLAKDIRIDILKSVHAAGSGHPGGSLSIVEVLIALYYNIMNVDPKNPKDENRDRLVLSKGHAAPALYAVLAEKGYFPKNDLLTLRKLGSNLQGHPDCKKLVGVDVNTGSLGQGASISVGLAMGAKHDKKNYKIFTILGDGECAEGIIWEAAMCAAHYKLDNLTFILDHNGLQIDGSNKEVMNTEDIVEKFKAFGFECYKIDGHDIDLITETLKKPVNNKPKFICLETIKGKGISFMENQVGWHGKAPNDEELEKALKELEVA